MGDVIQARFHLQWILPVWVILDEQRQPVDGPRQALACLNTRWPVNRDKLARTAMKLCRDALLGRGNCDEARRAFLRAAAQARIYW